MSEQERIMRKEWIVEEGKERRNPPGRSRLGAEFVLLSLAAPVPHVIFFDTIGLLAPLIAVLVAACALLAMTPGFRWREVVRGQDLARHVLLILGFAIVCGVAIFGFTLALMPERMFGFVRHDPARYALVMVLYPFLSVLGQEIVYRLLFFRRYRALFPNDGTAIVASAVAFSLGHAFYQNWIAITFTFAGGLVFAWAYVRTSSFLLVWILHSLAGWEIFTAGLGAFFYHGAISR
jgi:membrane protease YdiL (CAAX protease family)